jgi:peptidyl-prolyl cis-trans isomerase C
MFLLTQIRRRIYSGIALTLLLLVSPCRGQDAVPPIATVNKQPITQRDVDLELLISGIRDPNPADLEAALNRVIDRILVAASVEQPKGSDPLMDDVEDLVQFVRTGIESGGDSVDHVLGKLKLTEADIRQAARTSINWNAHVYRTVTDREIRSYFEQHRELFDGTQVHLRQIVRTVPSEAPASKWEEAESFLTDLRQQIDSGKLAFADAASAHSQSPSGKNGGDVGFVRYRGDIPAPVTVPSAARSVKTIRSTVGVHLVQVIERKPGDLSLEDARPAVLRVLGEQLWDKTVQKLRARAKITR